MVDCLGHTPLSKKMLSATDSLLNLCCMTLPCLLYKKHFSSLSLLHLFNERQSAKKNILKKENLSDVPEFKAETEDSSISEKSVKRASISCL